MTTAHHVHILNSPEVLQFIFLKPQSIIPASSCFQLGHLRLGIAHHISVFSADVKLFLFIKSPAVLIETASGISGLFLPYINISKTNWSFPARKCLQSATIYITLYHLHFLYECRVQGCVGVVRVWWQAIKSFTHNKSKKTEKLFEKMKYLNEIKYQ